LIISLEEDEAMSDQSTLRSIAAWLSGIEEIAGKVYRAAAHDLGGDWAGGAAFLERMAADEERHRRAMNAALEFMAKNEMSLPSDILLDDTTKQHIETPFRVMQELLESGNLTRSAFIDNFLASEFSEWNTLFLYIINTLKEVDRTFQHSAAEMQHHLGEIEEFVASLPEGREYLNRFDAVPKVWERKILVVDDSPVFRAFLSSLLRGIGTIEKASDGLEALEKASTHHYDAIVSDVQMPVMDGPEFYKRLARTDPQVHSRLLFFTATPTDALEAFFRDEELRYMAKPAPIDKLQEAVRAILKRRR
jgi:two-component system, chemotaxis family, chemotaxis protein CheY